MHAEIRSFVFTDYPEARTLWLRTEGIDLDASDEPAAIQYYLERNPRLSAVAQDGNGQIVGTVLCGHDGRRGSLHHLAVAHEWRNKGIGGRLLEYCSLRLVEAGIPKCNISVLQENTSGLEFWLRHGWFRTPWLNLQVDVKQSSVANQNGP